MYVRHKFRCLIGTRTEAELLGELWTCRAILLQGTPDSLKGVRGLFAELAVCLIWLLCASVARVAVCSSVQSERSVFPLTIITPHGPGILSLRYA